MFIKNFSAQRSMFMKKMGLPCLKAIWQENLLEVIYPELLELVA